MKVYKKITQAVIRGAIRQLAERIANNKWCYDEGGYYFLNKCGEHWDGCSEHGYQNPSQVESHLLALLDLKG